MDAAIVTYARKTRRGAVRKEVAEKYVRDDVGCGLLRGAPVDAAFIASTAEAARRAGEPCGWVVPDTNVVLHQMDVLEHGGVDATLLDRLIICQTVAEEVKHNDRQLFRRLCALLADERRDVVLFANEHVAGCAPARGPRESPNDANDRAIRSVAATFAAICGADGDPRRFAGVVLVTDDAACRALGIKERLYALATAELAGHAPALADLVADRSAAAPRADRSAPRPKLYGPHAPMSELLRGVAAGDLVEGVFRGSCAGRSTRPRATSTRRGRSRCSSCPWTGASRRCASRRGSSRGSRACASSSPSTRGPTTSATRGATTCRRSASGATRPSRRR